MQVHPQLIVITKENINTFLPNYRMYYITTTSSKGNHKKQNTRSMESTQYINVWIYGRLHASSDWLSFYKV